MKGFLEGFLFRPQGKPMAYPYSLSARVSQYPWRFMWHESWIVRYWTFSALFIVFPLYYKIDKVLCGPENTALWTEKRKKDVEHHRHHLEKLWETWFCLDKSISYTMTNNTDTHSNSHNQIRSEQACNKVRRKNSRGKKSENPSRISINGEPRYFLEPTLDSESMFLGFTQNKRILGLLLKDGELIKSQESVKLYFLSKLGLVPKTCDIDETNNYSTSQT